eukprot:6261345-Pyramimonas_sp.AAC.1
MAHRVPHDAFPPPVLNVSRSGFRRLMPEIRRDIPDALAAREFVDPVVRHFTSHHCGSSQLPVTVLARAA